MGNVSKRRVGELTRALFGVLLKHPESMQAKDALAALAEAITLTDYEQGFYAPGVPRFDKIVRFATIDTVKAGWLVKSKGRWTVTDNGRRAFDKHKDAEAFYGEAQRLYREWASARTDTDLEPEARNEADEHNATVTFEAAEEQAWAEIEAHLRTMPPYEFQELVAALLRAMGYHVAWVAPPGKDGGIDILAFRDPLGTQPPRIKVQVKRHATAAVPVDGLRSFMALLGDDDVGLFVSTADRASEVRASLVRWFTDRASQRLPERVERWRRKAGVPAPAVVVKDQRKRWGSCDRRGVVRFNWRIIQAPMRLVDYVVAHELCHLAHKDHDRAYWSLLGRVLPDYDDRRRQLAALGPEAGW
jgi:restriction system protein